jgi:RNA polymerase sigma-70 factor (ECF subfamily)
MTAPKRDDERCARFQVLYEANYDRILGYALRRTQHAEALDVVAETFTVAWRRLEQVPAGDEARLWLYGTARRVLANHERAARRRIRLGGRLADEAAASQRVERPSSGGAVAAAFARLGAEDRELLALVVWEGLDARALARVLGCSRNAARIRLHRARRRFERALTEAGESVKRELPAGHVSLTPIRTEDSR